MVALLRSWCNATLWTEVLGLERRMLKTKQILMAAATFSVALGIGFFMQNGDAMANRFAVGQAQDGQLDPSSVSNAGMVQNPFEAAPEADLSHEGPEQGAVETPDMLEEDTTFYNMPSEAVLLDVAELDVVLVSPVFTQSAEAEQPDAVEDETQQTIVILDAEETAVEEIVEEEERFVEEVVVEEENCTPEMVAVAAPSALVQVALTAPCNPSTAFILHHQGMMFSAQTDDSGRVKLTVPALAATAVMIAAFDNGNGAVASVSVPDFADFDRVLLQWQGDIGVMLSAYEGEAAFGDTNHIYRGNTGGEERLANEEGGFLTLLGDPSLENPLMAEVYTTSATALPQDVHLMAEAEITESNCGQPLNAQSLQLSRDGSASVLDLNLTMPDCDAVGDVLILQNMFEDLTLASR